MTTVQSTQDEIIVDIPPQQTTVTDNSNTNGHNNNNSNNNINGIDDDLEHELSRDADSFVDIVNYLGDNNGNNNNNRHTTGSTVLAASVNFTNCIIGAGAIGLGGAIAKSGGIISIVFIIFFAILVKFSLDLVILLSLQHNIHSYEELGIITFGQFGKFIVMISKFAYAFGCLIAYVVVVKDNFGRAMQNLIYGKENDSSSFIYWFLGQDILCTWVVSAVIIFPLCLLRDMTPLASFSVISVISMISIVAIVIYLWWIDIANNSIIMPEQQQKQQSISLIMSNYTIDKLDGRNLLEGTTLLQSNNNTTNNAFLNSNTFYEHWIKIHWNGLLDNMGTFLFAFVCQHTVHLVFHSLKHELQTLQHFKTVSTYSLSVSCLVSLAVGVFVYMTYWDKTDSDIFEIYPDSTLLDLAKLLLCITMLLTFPLPFFACRELVIVFFFPFADPVVRTTIEEAAMTSDLEEPLLQNAGEREQAETQVEIENAENCNNDVEVNDNVVVNHNETSEEAAPAPDLARAESAISSMDLSVLSARAIEVMNSVLLPDQDRQLKLFYHVGLSFKLWFVATGLAIAAPNLGDVLDLVGCFSGTLIAFILPGSFALKLQGYSHEAASILLIGGVVGVFGTICSTKKVFDDTFLNK